MLAELLVRLGGIAGVNEFDARAKSGTVSLSDRVLLADISCDLTAAAEVAALVAKIDEVV